MATKTVKTETKKEEVKVTATKVEDAKAEPAKKEEAVAPVKEVEKEEAPKVAAEKKTTAAKKTTTAKKTTAAKKTTTTAKKTTVAKAKEVAAKFILQYQHIEVEEAELLERFKGIWAEMGRKESEIKELSAYVKPEEYCAYFVVNNIDTVRVFL